MDTITNILYFIPIIGIVGRTNKAEYNKYKIIVNDNQRRAVIVCGGIPNSILPTQNIEYEKMDNRKANQPLNKEEQNDIIRVIKMCDDSLKRLEYPY